MKIDSCRKAIKFRCDLSCERNFANPATISTWDTAVLNKAEERWSLFPYGSVFGYRGYPCASLGWLSPRASYSISGFSQPSLRGSSTGLLTHVRRIDARQARCFLVTAPVSDVRVSSSATGYHDPSRAIHEFASALHDRHALSELATDCGGICNIQRNSRLGLLYALSWEKRLSDGNIRSFSSVYRECKNLNSGIERMVIAKNYTETMILRKIISNRKIILWINVLNKDAMARKKQVNTFMISICI